MKKTIYLFISLIITMYSHAGTLKDVTASCGYAWYGFGSHQSGVGGELTVQGFDLVNSSGKWVSTIRAIPYFNHRMFVDNWIVVPETISNNQTFTLKTEPTEQNFKFDSFFKLQKANGLTNIWSASGCFDWYVPNLGGKSQRKTACYDPTLPPSNPKAWLDLAHLCKLIALHYKDTELLDYIQVLNEWDFRWNVPYILKPQEYAVGFRMCYNAIRSVSPKQGVMIGATLTADMATAKLLMRSIDSVFILNGEAPPRDIVYTVNNYIRTGDSNQGSGVAATPETVDRYNTFFKPLNDFCKSIGIKYAITETGYNSSPSNSASALKNKAPSLEGYTLEEAQGILDLRIILQNASLSECVMVCLYHCKDGYEAEPFTYHGLNYDKDFGGKTDWSAKPARTIIEAYLSEYGKRDIQNFRQKDNLYGVDLIASTDTITLVWTNLNKSGEYDAKPRIGKLQLPNNSPSITLTSPVNAQVYTAPATVILSVNASDSDGNVTRVEFKQNGNLIFTDTQNPYTYTVNNLPSGTYTFSITAFDNSNLFSTIGNIGIEVNPATTTGLKVLNHTLTLDGTPFKIRGHNSPENILHWLNYPFLDWLYTHGANSIYASVNNKESGKPQLSVWVNNNPANGFDEAKVNAWVAYAQYWLAKDPRNVFQLVLFEKETLNLWTLQQQKDMITYLSQKFAAFNGRILINTEEADNGWSRLNALYDHIKQVAPSWIRALHCNTNQNPWSGNYNTDRIQILSMQDNISAFNNHINTEVPKNQHWVAIASEMTGGFQPNDVAKAETLWNAGGSYNVGVEVYIACCDQTNPASNWYQAYAPVFDKLKSLATGTTNPPTPSTIEIRYSASYTRSPSVVLNNGTTVPQGSYWLFSNVPVNWELKKGTSIVKTTTNSLYLNGNSNTYFQRGFTYTLTTTNPSGSKVINFIVQ